MKKTKSEYFRKVKTKCVVCGDTYEVKPSRIKKTKCCSKKCFAKYQSTIRTGIKFSEGHKKKISESKMGEKHPLWKIDAVSYVTLHDWVRRHKGKPVECVYCGGKTNISWASISHKAKRDLNDYISLCRRCHFMYDYPNGREKVNNKWV